GWIDRAFIAAHTVGFDELAAHVARFPLAQVAEATGVPCAEIEQLAELIHRGRRVSLWWTMGVNQSHEGVRVAQAIINIALSAGPAPAQSRSRGSATRWARGCSPTPPTCSAAMTSPTPITARRSPRFLASIRLESRRAIAWRTTRSCKGSREARSAGCGSSGP